MKNKSFSNKIEELKAKASAHREAERKLVPRLKIMGYIMLFLCLTAFVFAMTINEEAAPEQKSGIEEDTEIEATTPELTEEELEPLATEVLNFYAVSAVFALVGGFCFLIAWKKRKTLYEEPHTTNE